MDDFKLKLVVTILGSIIFSFIFIILAFVLPTKSGEETYKRPSHLLEQVSESIRK